MLSNSKIKDIYPTLERYCKYLCKYTPRIDYKDLCSDVFLILSENINKIEMLPEESDALNRYTMRVCKNRFINLVAFTKRRCKITNHLDPDIFELNSGRDSDDYSNFEIKDLLDTLDNVCTDKEKELIKYISKGVKGEALYDKTGLKRTEIYRMKRDIRYKLSKLSNIR